MIFFHFNFIAKSSINSFECYYFKQSRQIKKQK